MWRTVAFVAILVAVAHGSPLSWLFGESTVADTTDVSLHPRSPREADPDHVRNKRQAYQVYVGGDVSITVDHSGQAESGVWGYWNRDKECSRTCGGGVQIEKRQCNGVCTGPSVRYVSCNTEPCPEGSKDFRAEQCAEHNDSPLDGDYYEWVPHRGKNKCELTCKPKDGNFYYKWNDKVVDGTKCDHLTNDICVEGVCLPLGCDGKLGSSVKEDKCGVCGGDQSTCKTVEGLFDERNISPGYHDIIVLPVGATYIRVEEMRPTTNNLAIRNSSGHYYLNGNFQIVTQAEKELLIAGTLFEYDKRKENGHAYEKIVAKGPLDEELTIALIFQSGNKHSAIQYEFSVPLESESDIPYIYRPGTWSPCSVTCGKGVETREPLCIETATQQRVRDEICEENNASRPLSNRTCETVNCEAEWFEGEWEECSQSCGDQGSQYRVVYCHKEYADGRRITVDDSECSGERPSVQQTCNRWACPEWNAGPWSACSEKCGDAWQYRSVTCRSEKPGEEGKLLPAESCNEANVTESERSCNLGPCEGLKFTTGEWKLCEKCNDTEETRDVVCKDTTGRQYPLEKCLNEEVKEKPIDTRSCATVMPCLYEWHTSEWSKCSTECGHGHETRRVVCAIHELGDLTVLDESHCNPSNKPVDKQNCTNEATCTGTFYTGPWTECTEKCGGGTQTRMAVCLNYDKQPVPEWCDERDTPALEQECNTEDCPTCFDSEFGCCPDNSTYASGPFNEGCSNCSTSEFGCCDDNVTDATGPDAKGCPEYNATGDAKDESTDLALDVAEGSGEEDEELCEVTNEAGETAKVPCPDDKLLLDSNATLTNETLGENETIHCSKTEFKCCPDWYTPAEGPNNAGCPSFTTGACNGTQYGCCPDEVSLARGANLEGCGEPSCAASLYGCCKDRRTIAFGPHYAGCERSSFPCELSEFGCCPDGETAALGRNGKGCGEDCLVTKFGCCPDGITISKGRQNEGCGCQFAQYGCCPDGKNAAKGAGYYGCPDSCAQSQYGCCPDGVTASRGPLKEGCPCQYTQYGCCPDGETTALGPKNDGCDDCRYAKYSCCPDGITKAIGPNYAGCPSTTLAPFMQGGTVAPAKIASCSLPQDTGTVCHPGYRLVWSYDPTEGRCIQFWYGGCDGNDNRFPTEEQCKTICVDPPGVGRCYLPKVEGPDRCNSLSARYWYDFTTRQCGAFWWRGCDGNSNNFDSWASCQAFCEGIGAPEQERPRTEAPRPEPTTPAPRDDERAPSYNRDTTEEDQYCRESSDSGPCKDYEDMWYFDSFSGHCHPFIYGGCGGNYNRYRTIEECEQRCGHLERDSQGGSHADGDSESKARDVCNLRMDVGKCEGHFDSYYYEVATGTCVSFQYSGCGGNGNRFHSKQQCEDLCIPNSRGGRVQPHVGLAGAGRVGGGDRGVQPHVGLAGAGRVGGDQRVVVQPHVGLAGAGRVPNPPRRQEFGQLISSDNPAAELPVCEQDKVIGPCTNFIVKWYFKREDGTCERFHYGGCEGNDNRFETEQDCIQRCGQHIDACELPPVPGPCRGLHDRFYFDRKSGRCLNFKFGGCLGNANNFETAEECQQRCAGAELQVVLPKPAQLVEDLCSLSADAGPCGAQMSMFFYDSNLGDCRSFAYGGCEGNANRFESINLCRDRCVRDERQQALVQSPLPEREEVTTMITNEVNDEELPHDEFAPRHAADEGVVDGLADQEESEEEEEEESKAYPMPTSLLPELCQLPEDVGTCFGQILQWRYDTEVGMCVSFMFTGCDGNANRFSSEESCQRACGVYRDQDVCKMERDGGGCKLSLTKWYYDASLGECHTFVYGGCHGNGNRFSSKEECQQLCRVETKVEDVCSLERDSGPCNDPISQWYYDADSDACKLFTWGGCRGNANRFDDKEQCEKRCKSTKTQSLVAFDSEVICTEPFEAGPCRAAHQRYYFDPASGRCRSFVYGGCEGNGNRFDTESDCALACAPLIARHAHEHRAVVRTRSSGPFRAGATIILDCQSRGQTPVRWFFGERQLDLTKPDHRLQVNEAATELKIFDSRASDAGWYKCAAGVTGILSEPIEISVKEAPVEESCQDQDGSASFCAMILKTDLCTNARYGKHCCRTCKSAGFSYL